jgi:alpha-tubulin suppressor-like RCC1 family protein
MITFTYSPVAATDSIASGASTNLTYQQTNQTQATVPIHFSANLQSTSAKLSIGGTNFSQTYNVSPDPFYPTSSSGIVALTNNSVSPGGAIANYISAALTSTDGSFTLNPDTSDTSNCTYGKSLGMTGGYCDIRVHFSPKSVGPINATLTVTYFDLGLNQNVVQTSTLSGMGTVPIHVFAGGGVSCITDETEQAVCWGDNTYGQLGQGNNGSWNMSPQKMPKINFGASVQVLQLAVSAQHVCAIVNTPTVKGAVTCWGSNDSGRLGLGLGNSGQLDSPTSSGNLKIVDLVDSTGNPEVATQISAGYGHVCALFKDQTMKCWGLNSSYQLGNNNTNNIGSSLSQMGIQLSHINLGGPIASIAAGTAHTCATLVNGSTYCWGDNGYGELGQGMNNLTLASPALVKMGTHPSVVSAHLATNSAMTCLLLTDGTSTCFGQSSYSDGNQTFNGTLGICMARQNNDYTQPASLCWNSPSLVPTDKYGVLGSDVGSNLSLLPFSTPISKMTVGGQHGCVLFNTGSNGACWGSNSNGQLGNGNTSSVGAGKNDLNSSLVHSFSPVPGHTPTEIAAGVLHSCAVFTDNSVKCWGEGTIDNANGMGADTSAIADQLSPVYIGSSI